jgi:hypothetical protein
MPKQNKKAVAGQLLEIKAQRAGQFGGRYTLHSALHNIALAQKFAVELLAAEEKKKEINSYALTLLAQHLPIMMVATMQSFFRDAVAELIDHGEPFAARAAQLIDSSNLNVDYPIFLAVQKKKFTLGQFISDTIRLSSLEAINATLSILVDRSFLDSLKDEKLNSKLWESERVSIRQIGDDPGPIFPSVKRIIEIRNSIAHESDPVDGRATLEEITRCCAGTKVFLIGAETHLFRILHPGELEFPNNYEMKEYASRQLRKAEDTLQRVLEEYKNRLARLPEYYKDNKDTYKRLLDDCSERALELDNLQKRWSEFAKLSATFAANEYKGGTIYGLIYMRDLEASTLARIQELRGKMRDETSTLARIQELCGRWKWIKE